MSAEVADEPERKRTRPFVDDLTPATVARFVREAEESGRPERFRRGFFEELRARVDEIEKRQSKAV